MQEEKCTYCGNGFVSLTVVSLERDFHIFHKEIKELSTKNTLNFTSRDAMIFMSKRWLQVADKNDYIYGGHKIFSH